MTAPRTVLISGCSSGLGLALVHLLHASGWRVYAGVRKTEDAARLPEGAQALILDVTEPDQIASAVARIEEDAGRLDALVNNAGVNAIGPWEVVPLQTVRAVMEVNFFGAVSLTRAVLPLMRRHQAGTIVMVSSLSALIGLPGDGVYAASKFALEGFAESLSYEVRRWNIRVLIANPGGYATELARKAWRPRADESGDYGPLVAQLLAGRGGDGKADDAAGSIAALLEQPGGPLRNPLDATARRVFGVLGFDRQAERSALARNASGLGWWCDGEAGPAADREGRPG